MTAPVERRNRRTFGTHFRVHFEKYVGGVSRVGGGVEGKEESGTGIQERKWGSIPKEQAGDGGRKRDLRI